MLMGYVWHGVCYQDTASVLAAFTKDAVLIDAAGITSFTAAPSISASGLITWSISHRPLTGTAATTRTGATQLLSCTDSEMAQWPLQSLGLYVACFFAVFLGFRTGFRA